MAIEALVKGASWVTHFMQWIDSKYGHLIMSSEFTKKQAWALATQLAMRLFTYISGVRLGLIEMSKTGPKALCTSLLWGIFQTHDRMEDQ
jgi:hypothetical protein